MARKPRVEFDGAFYHVIVRGNQRQRTFYDGDFCTRSQGFYGNGPESLAQEVACYGGFNGAYNANGDQTQAFNPGTCNATLITIGTRNLRLRVAPFTFSAQRRSLASDLAV